MRQEGVARKLTTCFIYKKTGYKNAIIFCVYVLEVTGFQNALAARCCAAVSSLFTSYHIVKTIVLTRLNATTTGNANDDDVIHSSPRDRESQFRKCCAPSKKQLLSPSLQTLRTLLNITLSHSAKVLQKKHTNL